MEYVLKHKDADVTLTQTGPKRHLISVNPVNENIHITIRTWETSYPIELVDKMLQTKGPAYLCDDIMRDESAEYVEKNIRFSVLSYVSPDQLVNKEVLDFGCGTGASTMVLSRLFPNTRVIGVELEEDLLELAKSRAAYYQIEDRVQFFVSPDGSSLPEHIGSIDYIFLNAVYEHLLPEERKTVLPLLWKHLKPGGVIFVNQTPYRWFPVEFHTTGLLFINYMPEFLALAYARRFYRPYDWPTLLRQGIRGGSVREICALLNDDHYKPMVLDPSELGLNDRIDIWYAISSKSRYILIKKTFLYLCKAIKLFTGLIFLPSLSLAIQKPTKSNASSHSCQSAVRPSSA